MNRIQSIATVILTLLVLPDRAVAQPGDAARGERTYRACVACHSLEPNRNMTGPSLAEVWNRKSGSLSSFPPNTFEVLLPFAVSSYRFEFIAIAQPVRYITTAHGPLGCETMSLRDRGEGGN
jgi:hypothetical protein